MLEEWAHKYVLPDIIAGRKGWATLIEVKTKSRATRNAKRKRDEHGIPLRHWNDYRQVCEKSGLRGYLGVLQLQPLLFGLGELTEIGQTAAYYDGPKFPEPMVFFDIGRFEEWWGEDAMTNMPVPPPKPIPPKTIHPWEKGTGIETQGIQKSLF